jgi:hypothetical protein
MLSWVFFRKVFCHAEVRSILFLNYQYAGVALDSSLRSE